MQKWVESVSEATTEWVRAHWSPDVALALAMSVATAAWLALQLRRQQRRGVADMRATLQSVQGRAAWATAALCAHRLGYIWQFSAAVVCVMAFLTARDLARIAANRRIRVEVAVPLRVLQRTEYLPAIAAYRVDRLRLGESTQRTRVELLTLAEATGNGAFLDAPRTTAPKLQQQPQQKQREKNERAERSASLPPLSVNDRTALAVAVTADARSIARPVSTETAAFVLLHEKARRDAAKERKTTGVFAPVRYAGRREVFRDAPSLLAVTLDAWRERLAPVHAVERVVARGDTPGDPVGFGRSRLQDDDLLHWPVRFSVGANDVVAAADAADTNSQCRTLSFTFRACQTIRHARTDYLRIVATGDGDRKDGGDGGGRLIDASVAHLVALEAKLAALLAPDVVVVAAAADPGGPRPLPHAFSRSVFAYDPSDAAAAASVARPAPPDWLRAGLAPHQSFAWIVGPTPLESASASSQAADRLWSAVAAWRVVFRGVTFCDLARPEAAIRSEFEFLAGAEK